MILPHLLGHLVDGFASYCLDTSVKLEFCGEHLDEELERLSGGDLFQG